MSDSGSEVVTVLRDGAVGIIRLDRPQVGNAVDLAAAQALSAAAHALTEDPHIRAVVLCGEGPRFCVGGDLSAFRSAGSELPSLLRQLAGGVHDAIITLVEADLAVVAAVQGAVAGVGVSLVAACDIVVAEESAFFTTAYTGLGLTPDGGATFTLAAAIGARRAKQVILTNRRFSAVEAAAWGLVDEVVPDGESLKAAVAAAARVAAIPRTVVGSTKRLFELARPSTLREQLEREVDAIAAAAANLDFS